MHEPPATTGHCYDTKDEWEVDRSHITFDKYLRDGHFGDIWLGQWKGKQVAVKLCNPKTVKSEDFFFTADIMKKLYHKKVIQLHAVCTQKKPFYIVTEFMKYDSLVDYFKKEGHNLTLPDLMDMAAQVVSGMIYLGIKHCLHRNLAARNIKVGDCNIVKIDNFSRARIAVNGEYIASSDDMYPIRWTAPESGLYNRYSVKSDVWSFGILLMELITRGRTPYPHLRSKDVMIAVESGYRMPCPRDCPEWLYRIMLDCWNYEPKDRPMFDHLKVSLLHAAQLLILTTCICSHCSN